MESLRANHAICPLLASCPVQCRVDDPAYETASTLVALTIVRKNDLPMSLAGFVKLGIPFAVLQIVLATAYVLLFLQQAGSKSRTRQAGVGDYKPNG